MNPEILPAKLSIAILAALVAPLAMLVARGTKAELSSEPAWGFAALGLIVFCGEAATGAALSNHTAVTWAYLIAATFFSGAYFLRREYIPVWPSLMLMLAMAYLFAPPTYWRSSLTLLLFIWSLFTAIDFARGREPDTIADPRFPARLPLRRPKRIRGAREAALAAGAGALALIFGFHLFWPDPPPVVAQPAQEETAAPDTAEAPAESAEPKVPAVAEPPASEPATLSARAGDTFKSIAKRVYGDASRASDIARANPDVKPNARLRAGRKINLPKPPKPSDD